MVDTTLPILDTHQHLIDTRRLKYGWTDTVPQLANCKFDYEDYAAASAGTGIRRTVFMETSPDAWRDEAAFVYELAERRDSLIAGIIANCRPEEEGFDAYLDSIQERRLVGMRRICHVMPDGLSREPRFVENVRKLAARRLTFDLCFLARQLPLAAALVRACPDVQFILDHCGVPDIAAGTLDPWCEDLRAIALLPNVACKISGVLAYCRPDNANIDALRPYVRHTIECFGPDRLVWGSDWPLVNFHSSLAEWVRITRELLAHLSPDEQARILEGNAARIYRVRKSDA